jgi:hypothetical protein
MIYYAHISHLKEELHGYQKSRFNCEEIEC